MAQRALPGAADVSITLVRRHLPYTAACTGDLAKELDERQYEHHRGPCLQAAAENTTISVPDTATAAFDDDAVTLARSFAGYAAVALANAYAYHSTADLARNLQAAMDSRAVIEQAKGIIMAEQRCGPDEAFAFLTAVSQRTIGRSVTSPRPWSPAYDDDRTTSRDEGTTGHDRRTGPHGPDRGVR